jgi:hypothetical protein
MDHFSRRVHEGLSFTSVAWAFAWVVMLFWGFVALVPVLAVASVVVVAVAAVRLGVKLVAPLVSAVLGFEPRWSPAARTVVAFAVASVLVAGDVAQVPLATPVLVVVTAAFFVAVSWMAEEVMVLVASATAPDRRFSRVCAAVLSVGLAAHFVLPQPVAAPLYLLAVSVAVFSAVPVVLTELLTPPGHRYRPFVAAAAVAFVVTWTGGFLPVVHQVVLGVVMSWSFYFRERDVLEPAGDVPDWV